MLKAVAPRTVCPTSLFNTSATRGAIFRSSRVCKHARKVDTDNIERVADLISSHRGNVSKLVWMQIYYVPKTPTALILNILVKQKAIFIGDRNSVWPSVRPSHACLVTKRKNVLPIFWYRSHERTITLVFWYQQNSVSDVSFHLKFALNWFTPLKNADFVQYLFIPSHTSHRASENSLIIANMKSTTRFPTSYRWNAYVTHKGWLKKRICRFLWIKFKFSRLVCYKVCLCENVQRHSCSTIISLSDVCIDVGGKRNPST